jgi:hypothetical protein
MALSGWIHSTAVRNLLGLSSMRHLILGAVLSMAGTASLSGCLETQTCTTEYRFGVNVTLRNARSGAPVPGATVVIVDGSWRETLSTFGLPGSYAGAGEREGSYTLSVEAPGFVSPAARTVVVTGSQCHVNGVSVTIDLTPL